jgi:hypothetical protein
VRIIAVPCLLAVLAFWPADQQPDKPKTDPVGKITLQYRVARDAFAPSRFVAVIDDGLSPPLAIIWDLARPDKDTREALETQKIRFDALIRALETQQINGVEFECQGVWIQKGAALRITTVPEPTEAGKQRITNSAPRQGGQPRTPL